MGWFRNFVNKNGKKIAIVSLVGALLGITGTAAAQQLRGYVPSRADSVEANGIKANMPDSFRYYANMLPDTYSINVFRGESSSNFNWRGDIPWAPNLYPDGFSFFLYNLEGNGSQPRYGTFTRSSDGARKTVTFPIEVRNWLGGYHDGQYGGDLGEFVQGSGEVWQSYLWSPDPANPDKVMHKSFTTTISNDWGDGMAIQNYTPTTFDTSTVTWDGPTEKQYDFSITDFRQNPDSSFTLAVANDAIFGRDYTATVDFQLQTDARVNLEGNLGDRLGNDPETDENTFDYALPQGTYNVTCSLYSRPGELENVFTTTVGISEPPNVEWHMDVLPDGPRGKRLKGLASVIASNDQGDVAIGKGKSKDDNIYLGRSDPSGGFTFSETDVLYIIDDVLPQLTRGNLDKGSRLIEAEGRWYLFAGKDRAGWFGSIDTAGAEPKWRVESPYLTSDGKYAKDGSWLTYNDSLKRFFLGVGKRYRRTTDRSKEPIIAHKHIHPDSSWHDEDIHVTGTEKGKFYYGADGVATPDGIIFNMGKTNEVKLLKYNMDVDPLDNFPTSERWRGDLAYNPVENAVYAIRGDKGPDMYRMDLNVPQSEWQWTDTDNSGISFPADAPQGERRGRIKESKYPEWTFTPSGRIVCIPTRNTNTVASYGPGGDFNGSSTPGKEPEPKYFSGIAHQGNNFQTPYENKTYTVYNVAGREVETNKTSPTGYISTATLNPGLYLASFNQPDEETSSATYKLVVQK